MKNVVLSVRIAPELREAFDARCTALGMSSREGFAEAIGQWVGSSSETTAQRRERVRAELVEAVRSARERRAS